jgi:hypothetical protein
MMKNKRLKDTSGTTQRRKPSQILKYRRRLRHVIIDSADRFLKTNPQWGEYFFDVRFLLNRGLPIIERHITGAISNGGIDLALAWAENWPSMNVSQRKACLQAQTVIAAELLRLVTETMLLPRPVHHDAQQAQAGDWRGVGVPFAYVQSLNPPGRSTMRLHLSPTVALAQGDLLK